MITCEVVGLKEGQIESNWQALSQMGHFLMEAGIVKKGFIDAVIQREAEFSTGLRIGDYGVAIPHTDTQYVNQSAIAVMTLSDPVVFHQMGDGVEVPVHMVCMLALKEAHAHLDMLQKLMAFFHKSEEVDKIIQLEDTVANRQAVVDVFKANHII